MEKQLVLVEISLVLAQSNLWVSAGHSTHPITLPSLPCFHPSSEPISFVRRTKNSSSSEILTWFCGSWWVLPSVKHDVATGQMSWLLGLHSGRARAACCGQTGGTVSRTRGQADASEKTEGSCTPLHPQTLLASWDCLSCTLLSARRRLLDSQNFPSKTDETLQHETQRLEAFPSSSPQLCGARSVTSREDTSSPKQICPAPGRCGGRNVADPGSGVTEP